MVRHSGRNCVHIEEDGWNVWKVLTVMICLLFLPMELCQYVLLYVPKVCGKMVSSQIISRGIHDENHSVCLWALRYRYDMRLT